MDSEIIKTAKGVLQQEAAAINQLQNYIDEDFEKIVSLIFNSTGRVVITGIGKSAIIANKIVATLNSTGTPAVFMHAADAIHGDLGMVQAEDVVICISKSGTSPEIKVLVPLLKKLNVPLVGLVSRMDSYLAKNAHYTLNATIGQEACPNNLAPTTSTTAHLALGDALAICLLKMRGFTPNDFAKYHPGGSLGKQLYLKVDDLYINNECPVVTTMDSVKEAIISISEKRIGATAVINEHGKLVGIITDGDIRRMLEKGTEFIQLKAQDIMSPHPKSIKKGEFALKALEIMKENNISQLIVTENHKVVGFVHLHDLLKEGIV
ncbi:MAG: KpsF/GutQ family sugar-phosphate isomerase [Cyclobacteriaceae bacterium]|nr:KpsF/GutQ family sugar-phosphate isomerase [Cyclobacteriaceae bacterium]MCH8517543.1 KpsF/GutQ family sugar-phosphate isomerase [Cyclobacteriaceae bacterium]